MIREYVGTAEGKTLAVYKKLGHTLEKKFSNGFYCAVENDGRFNVVSFSRDEKEIDEFIKNKRQEGYKYVQMF